MPDIIEMLVEFLCQMNTQSQCWSFIGNYAEVTQQMVFFIFFPVVFLVLLVYFMSGAVVGTGQNAHRGLRMLVAVAIFVFIIFQGWYHIVLIVSKFWFIALIILGGLGVVVHRMTGRGGGVTGSPQKALEGGLLKTAKTLVLGDVTFDPHEIAKIRDQIKSIDNQIKQLEKRRAEPGLDPRQKEAYDIQIATLVAQRAQLERRLPPGTKMGRI